MAYTLEQIDAFYSSIDAVPGSLDSPPWTDAPVPDNYTVGTHGAAIADSQPRGRIWGLAGSIATASPPPRPTLFASPQHFDLGYGRSYRHPPATAPDPPGGAQYRFGTHNVLADLHSRAATWKYPHPNVVILTPEQYFVGSFFRIEQDSTEQPFTRFFRVAVLVSVAPTPPPNRPTLFAAPEQANLEPHARTFRVAVLPTAAGPPFKRLSAAPEHHDWHPQSRLFRVPRLPDADTVRIRPLFSFPPLEEQMPSSTWGYQPLDSDFIPPTEFFVVVPYLIGSLEGPARVAIQQIYCNVVVIGTTGSVVSQDPAPFTLVPRHTVITITLGGPINNGPGRRHARRPPYNSSIQ